MIIMKISCRISGVVLVILSALFFQSCKKGEIPVVMTNNIREITDVTALCGGTISSDGGLKVSTCGVCWSNDSSNLFVEKSEHTSDVSELNSFTSYITNLVPDSQYYVRAYCTNKAGTSYGKTISFSTKYLVNNIDHNPSISYGSTYDQDGNKYKTVGIGTQVWMAENLRVITFNDKKPIGGYCWYNDDVTSNKLNYGALYSWETVNTGKLCPAGWHVPTMGEIELLITNLGDDNIAGGKLKEAGTIHWKDPNTEAVNTSGFSALPGGYKEYTGGFKDMGNKGYWWSSTTITQKVTGVNLKRYCYMILYYDKGTAYWIPLNNGPQYNSVRCIKN
jgi:uncharacterized protein (TIGR02145 family)